MKFHPSLFLAALFLAACSEESAPVQSSGGAGDAAGAPAGGMPGRVYKSSLENVPDWVPLPAEYTVIMDNGTGVGNIVIEVPGDIRAIVAKMNEHLSAQGLKPIEEQENDRNGQYLAQGVISDRSKGMAVINIGEYDGPGSSYKPGNVASISYMISVHNLEE